MKESVGLINTQLERPPVDPINPKEDTIRFMAIDVDCYSDKPPGNASKDEGRFSNEVSIVRMYGVNEKGNSIVVHVFNFKPYFYMQIPATMHLDNTHLADLKHHMNQKTFNNFGNKNENIVTDLEIVERKSIMHFSDRMSRFVKIYTVLPRHIS